MPEIGLLSAGEVLMMVLVHQHQDADPLKLRRLALQMKPEVENQQRLFEVGFLTDATNAMGKPARGTVAISDEGVVAIRKNLRAVIAKLESDNSGDSLQERREQRNRIRKRLMTWLDKYPGPVAKAPTGPTVSRAEDPDDEEHETIIEPGQAAPEREEDEGGEDEPQPVRKGLAPAKGVMDGAAARGVIAKKLAKPVVGKKAPPARNPKRR